jgi:hypothetical protein
VKATKDWLRLLVQGLGVTASILLALALDAAWEFRQDRAEEAAEITQLQAEFTENRTRLVEARAMHLEILDDAQALLDQVDSVQVGSHKGIPAGNLLTLYGWWTFDPANGTLNSLIASGRLGLIENDDLRAALASWPDQVADFREEEEARRNLVDGYLVPRLFESVSVRSVLDPSQSADLISDAVFLDQLEGWLADRIWAERLTQEPDGELGNLLDEIDRILALLESERGVSR